MLIWTAFLIDGFELFKIILLCAVARSLQPILINLPLFLCSIQLIAIPLAAFTKGRIKEAALDFVCIFGILGAVLGVYGAGQNYNAYPVLSFHNVVSGITHALAGFASLYIMIVGMGSLKKKNIWVTFTILLCFCAAAYTANRLIPYNYMFLMAGDGTPYDILYNLVGGHPVWYPLSVIGLFLLYIIVFYGAHRWIEHKKKGRAAMKKIKFSKKIWLIALAAVLLAIMLALTVYFVIKTLQGSIKVFDLANFLSSLIFSCVALGFTIYEFAKQTMREMQVKQMEEKVKEMLEEKAEKLNALKQVNATDIIPDFPTYSDLKLGRMCELYDEFHTTFLKESRSTIKVYLEESQDMVDMILKRGEYLPSAVVVQAVSLSEQLTRLHEEFIEFQEISGVHYWQIFMAGKVKAGTTEETEMCKTLYKTGTDVCIGFNKLYSNVMLSKQRLNALCDAITLN